MLRIASRFCLVAAGFALSAAGLGCEFMSDPEFFRLQRGLALTIVEAKRSAVPGSVDFKFELKNGGPAAASACLGPSRSVWYEAGSGGGVRSDVVDHPGCEREFAIQPGSAWAWSETLEVSRLSQGVEVEVEVQIVNPRRCVSWSNCSVFDVRSNKVAIP